MILSDIDHLEELPVVGLYSINEHQAVLFRRIEYLFRFSVTVTWKERTRKNTKE